jgi:hypothetical protein
MNGLAPQEACAQCALEVAQIFPDDGASSDNAGYSLAVDGEMVVVGAPGDDDNGMGSGSAYAVQKTEAGWRNQWKLLPPDGGPDDQFGTSVAVSGDLAVVGAFGHGEGGAAYVFRFDGSRWAMEQKLLASDACAGDNFGYAVAASGPVALIGAYGVDDQGTSSGCAYVFRFNGREWIEEQKLHASDGAPYDFFGVSVAVSIDVAVVGAYLDDDREKNSGSAYVFRFDRGEWAEEQKLSAMDGVSEDRFGSCVAVSGDIVVVGAFQDDDYGSNSGSAHVYGFDGFSWREEAKLLAADGMPNDKFGASVAVAGETVLVGAYSNDAGGMADSGAAYVYRPAGSTWAQTDKLTAPDGWYWDYLGFSVAVSGDVLVAGAIQDDNNGNNSGSAYVFEQQCAPSGCRTDTECIDHDPCTADRCADGVCVHAPPPDFDGSGDVDLIDFGLFYDCMGAPTGDDRQPECQCADLTDDGLIDLRDYAMFQSAFHDVP